MSAPDIREQLRPLIMERGLRATARAAGIDHSSLLNWLRGKREISASTLQELIHVCGLRITGDEAPESQDD